MVTTAPSEKKEKGRQWQRAATRAAILAAARRLAEKGDSERLTLTGVAREADFAPTTVFAYFASKEDLFLAVLADDLAQFAASMRASAQQRQSATPAQQPAAPKEPIPAISDLPAQPPIDPNHAAVHLRVVEQAEPPPATQDVALAVAMPFGDVLSADMNSFHAVERELTRLREAVSQLEQRSVDPWLERRLREFERGLAALEARLDAPESKTAHAAVDESVRILIARMDGFETRESQAKDVTAKILREHAERIERSLKQTLSEFEAAHARDRVRLDSLENVAYAAAPQFFQARQKAHPEIEGDVKAEVENTSHAEVRAATETLATPEDAPPAASAEEASEPEAVSYIAAARRSALAAAELQKTASPVQKRMNHIGNRTLYAIAAALGLAVALIWTGVYFKAHAVAVPASGPAREWHASNKVSVTRKSPARAAVNVTNSKMELSAALKWLDGKPQDDAKAANMLLNAADRGDPVAAFKLATLYRDGRGVPADPAKAFRWFSMSAGKGNIKAMQSLAVAYAEGWGTAKNFQESARWFAHGASLGLTDAQFNLGVLYERGLGVPQSLADAYKWYLVAAAQGDTESRARVDALKSQLPASDVAAAEEAAASFTPVPADHGANLAPLTAQNPAG